MNPSEAAQRAPYGTWQSPITAERITGNSNFTTEVIVDAATSAIYHIESRPAEKGRCVLIESKTGRVIVGTDVNVRTGVHEYGGAPAIVHDGIAYYSNINDNRLYKTHVQEGSQAEPVTPDNSAYRYACFDIHPTKPRFLVSILEDHSNDTPATVVNRLVVIDTNAKTLSPLVSGADFYAFPRFSPDGKKLAWQHWNHPNMPWDASEISIADVNVHSSSISLENTTTIAGQNQDCSNNFLSWANNTTLCWVCDISGFINPWKYDLASQKASPIFPAPVAEDFSGCLWLLCFFPFAIVDEAGKVGVFSAYRDGRTVLYSVNLESGDRTELESPYVVTECVHTVSRSTGQFVFLGTKVDKADEIIIGSVDTSSVSGVSFDALKSAGAAKESPFDPTLVSVPRGMTLQDPADEKPLHVIYYPPHNPEYAASSIDGEKPPCVVNVHGGPTGMALQGLKWNIQYWTSRGFAWCDVNYGGSSGYGKQYISRLRGSWGVVDVEDCITASQLLASPPHSLIDPARTVIRGSSSGGLTVLGALSNSSNTKAYAAATSLYGVTDLVGLMEMTHKFESHYGFSLVGGSLKDNREKYEQRSPINHVDKIDVPLLILQGDIDRVVPKEQAEVVYESIKKRRGVVEYKLYPGEGHGWRIKETQRDALERELAFYEKILKL